MLAQLQINNIAVIDCALAAFQPHFNILTGETGAGKSIIIDAINMVLGERSSRDLIRAGESKAVVQALFEGISPTVQQKLEEFGFEVADDTLLLYRDVTTEGKSTCRINGQMATAGMVRDIARLLINIHGQQDSQALLTPSKHLAFLDSFGETKELLQQYVRCYTTRKELQGQLDALRMDEQTKAARVELLQFQAQEIAQAKLNPQEEEDLMERLALLGASTRIAETLTRGRDILYHGANQAPSVHDGLATVAGEMSLVAAYDAALNEMAQRLNGLSIELGDVIDQMRDYGDNLACDPAELDALEERMDLIRTLKRKYGGSVMDVIAYGEQAEQELDNVLQSEVRAEELMARLAQANEALQTAADALTQRRTRAAAVLGKKVEEQLGDLDMEKVRFAVSIEASEMAQTGQDQVEFLIATNLGEPLKPLSKIASGGEMSRIMLAIKSVLADSDEVGTLIFDEIDTGVSGRAAGRIAEKINVISRKRQVLCITHLAQIASRADAHFLIEKHNKDNKTSATITLLEGESRRDELARIIGGDHITPATLQTAAEMLQLKDGACGEQ